MNLYLYAKQYPRIRAQHKGQLDRSQEEIRVLTAEQGDLKALLDRAVRDKRSVEVFVVCKLISGISRT